MARSVPFTILRPPPRRNSNVDPRRFPGSLRLMDATSKSCCEDACAVTSIARGPISSERTRIEISVRTEPGLQFIELSFNEGRPPQAYKGYTAQQGAVCNSIRFYSGRMATIGCSSLRPEIAEKGEVCSLLVQISSFVRP